MMDLDALAEYLGRITVEVASGGHGVGAGVVCAPEWVVTNAHVVARAPVVVRGPDGQRTEALVVATNREADLAMLRVPGLSLAAPWAVAPETPRIGSLIVAMGHPFGVRGALTRGIVHAVGPITPGGRPWIQADLRLAPGNSGGPLADARGCLLGLNAMIVGGLALAIPMSEVKRFMKVAGAGGA